MNWNLHLGEHWGQWSQVVVLNGACVSLFAYSMAVIFDTPGFCMETVLYCSNFGLRFNDFNLYVMGKKYYVAFIVRNSCFAQLCSKYM